MSRPTYSQGVVPSVQIEGENARLSVINHGEEEASYVVMPGKAIPWFLFLKARNSSGTILTSGTDGWMLPADQDCYALPLPLNRLLPGEKTEVSVSLRSYLVGTRALSLIMRDTAEVNIRYRVALDGFLEKSVEAETGWIPFRFR